MTAWDGLNRRKFPRVRFPCLVIVKCDQEGEDVLLTHTENVGVGGLCVILKRNIRMFSIVSLELDLLDGNDHINCEGKIVWSVQRKSGEKKKPLFYDIGIEFLSMQDAEKKRLEEIVARLVQKGFQESLK